MVLYYEENIIFITVITAMTNFQTVTFQMVHQAGKERTMSMLLMHQDMMTARSSLYLDFLPSGDEGTISLLGCKGAPRLKVIGYVETHL